MNVIVIDGNLLCDPYMKTVPSGKRLAKFAMIHNELRSNKHMTSYINVVLWNDNADQAMHWYKKGDCVIVRGALRTKVYKTGNAKIYYFVEADKIEFGGAWNYLKKSKEKLTNYDEEYKKIQGEIVEKTDENGFDLMDDNEMDE